MILEPSLGIKRSAAQPILPTTTNSVIHKHCLDLAEGTMLYNINQTRPAHFKDTENDGDDLAKQQNELYHSDEVATGNKILKY